MKLFDFWKKNNLDEMQEQKMLKIEHRGFWLGYWGLFAALLLQAILYGYDLRALAGEFILLMVLSLYMVLAELRAGLWSRNLKPNLRTNVMCSVAGAAVVFLFTIVFYLRMGIPAEFMIPVALCGGVLAFGLTLALLQASLKKYKKQREKLDGEDEK